MTFDPSKVAAPLPGSVGEMLADDATKAATATTAPAAAPAAPAPAAPAAPAASTGDEPIRPDEVSGAKTPEEIEQYWRNRVSRKDSAHAAAEKALRDEIATLKAAQAAPASGSSGGQPGTDPAVNDRIETLQRELETERKARVVDQRKAKYPALAKQGVEDGVFATASEADLARLNALADDNADGGFIAPTAPRRSLNGSSSPQKQLHEKSKDELLADLKAASGPYEQFLRTGG